jgi:hypothetical protein
MFSSQVEACRNCGEDFTRPPARPVLAFLGCMGLIKRSIIVASGLISALMLMGFSGEEQYIELQGSFYGRDSSNFRIIDHNISTVLKTGTHGEILSKKLLPSGNYGMEVRVLSGESAGKTLWVYYNLKHPDIALYETAPQNWEVGSQPVPAPAMEKAQGMKALRDTPAFKAPAPKVARNFDPPSVALHKVTVLPEADRIRRKKQDMADTPALRNSLNTISHTNEVIRNTGTPPCVECSLANEAGQSISLRRPTKGMDPACDMMMNAQGKMGPAGRAVYSIMSEPSYRSFYLRGDSLGGFCPKFKNLTSAQKLEAWTWFWTALGQEESSCNPKLRHPTTYRDSRGRMSILNPREGYGMWAMEKDANVRASRGTACSNIGSVEGQARCSIDIMTRTQLARGREADVRVGSYWGPVMRGNSQIMPHMRRLNLCF